MREGAEGAVVHVAKVALQKEKEALLLLQRHCAGDDDGGVYVRAHATGDNGKNVISVAGLEVPVATKSKKEGGGGSSGIAYDILFSAHTRTPDGPASPPGTVMSKLAVCETSSLLLRTTWFRPKSSS